MFENGYPNGTPRCSLVGGTFQGQLELAIPAARRAWVSRHDASDAAFLARALGRAGDRQEALTVLDNAQIAGTRAPIADQFELHTTRAHLLLDGGDLEGARASLAAAEHLQTGDRRRATAWHELAAAIEERAGNHNEAAWHRERARLLRER